MQRQPPGRDVAAVSTCGLAEHRVRHLDPVHPARLTDAVEEELQPDAAAEPDVGDHRRRIRLQRLHGGAHEASIATIERRTD
jgi:hypothetical protein